jgi:hypothetical protein
MPMNIPGLGNVKSSMPQGPTSRFIPGLGNLKSSMPQGPTSRFIPGLANLKSSMPQGPTSRFIPGLANLKSSMPQGPTSRFIPGLANLKSSMPQGPTSPYPRVAPILESAKAAPRMHRNTKIGLGIAGAAAIGVVMNRRGEGSSSGRQSAYRY